MRLRLARIALEAALTAPGVVAGHDGPVGLRATRVGGERLRGVVAAADASGGYAVALHLVTRLVPLQPLGTLIRDEVEMRVAAAGLAAELARLDIVFEEVDPGEVH